MQDIEQEARSFLLGHEDQLLIVKLKVQALFYAIVGLSHECGTGLNTGLPELAGQLIDDLEGCLETLAKRREGLQDAENNAAEPAGLEKLIDEHRRAHEAFLGAIKIRDRLNATGRCGQDAERFLEAADRRWNETSAAEHDAALALCAYRCATMEEARRKAAYLSKVGLIKDHANEHVAAFLASFQSEGADHEG